MEGLHRATESKGTQRSAIKTVSRTALHILALLPNIRKLVPKTDTTNMQHYRKPSSSLRASQESESLTPENAGKPPHLHNSLHCSSALGASIYAPPELDWPAIPGPINKQQLTLSGWWSTNDQWSLGHRPCSLLPNWQFLQTWHLSGEFLEIFADICWSFSISIKHFPRL